MRTPVLLFVWLIAGCTESETPIDPGNDTDPDPEEREGSGEFSVALESVATGLRAPVYVTSLPGDDRLFVVEQDGTIAIIEDDEVLPTHFLDIQDRVSCCGERGLLGLAFHPDYASNGYFYVNYTDEEGGDTRVERYSVTADPNVADPSSGLLILTIEQPQSNHNGGQVEFGPDGMLYIALGDGGGRGDPDDNGQDLTSLLGKMLRIDVDNGSPYAIPADNPFIDDENARPEIWAWGLRNPWRFAIDGPGGRFYIADVGQSQLEEINVVPLDEGGLNFGWNTMEGTSCYEASSCDEEGLTLPVLEYDHGEGCSITGGLVYRGSAIPEMAGHYVYADYCSGWLRSFLMNDDGPTMEREWTEVQQLSTVTSFGRDANGEIYVMSGGAGELFRIVPRE